MNSKYTKKPSVIEVKRVKMPERSKLNASQSSYDYVDSYEGIFNANHATINIDTIGRSFFSSGPKWIDHLFAFQNKITRYFGLKTPDSKTDRKQQQLESFSFERGEQLGLFKVFDKTTNELILGEDDKHLNFRVSLFIPDNIASKRKLIISTTVIFNNWFGRLYFLPVKPFHKFIVPAMLRGIIKDLNKKSI